MLGKAIHILDVYGIIITILHLYQIPLLMIGEKKMVEMEKCQVAQDLDQL